MDADKNKIKDSAANEEEKNQVDPSTIKAKKRKAKKKKSQINPVELPIDELAKLKISSELNDTTKLLEPIPAPEITRNLENVLEAVKVVDVRCDLEKCKKKTNLFGHNCQFCSFRFCFEHSLPEIHGCGEKVRKKEREEFLHPIPLKTIRAKEEHGRAENRLKQKLNQMSLSRKAKPSGT